MLFNANKNDLDCIRLLAAIQVLTAHYFIINEYDFFLMRFIILFPGVPIFFFISWFLVSLSYENSKNSMI